MIVKRAARGAAHFLRARTFLPRVLLSPYAPSFCGLRAHARRACALRVWRARARGAHAHFARVLFTLHTYLDVATRAQRALLVARRGTRYYRAHATCFCARARVRAHAALSHLPPHLLFIPCYRCLLVLLPTAHTRAYARRAAGACQPSSTSPDWTVWVDGRTSHLIIICI